MTSATTDLAPAPTLTDLGVVDARGRRVGVVVSVFHVAAMEWVPRHHNRAKPWIGHVIETRNGVSFGSSSACTYGATPEEALALIAKKATKLTKRLSAKFAQP